MQYNEFSNKKIAILGFGVEGESAVEFLLKRNAIITVFDEKSSFVLQASADNDEFVKDKVCDFKKQGVEFVFGKFPSDFSNYDVIVRSPGVNPNLAEITNSLQKDVVLTSPTKIFFDLCPCKIIGVTGTKGKGTTSSLIFEMLKKQGFEIYLGGNIGNPPLGFLDKLKPDSWVVLELSSFQLQDLHKSPHVAVILMITSEHLDYHKDVKEYVEAKRNILRFQSSSDFAVINRDYPASLESDICSEAKIFYVSREQKIEAGCYVEDGDIKLKINPSAPIASESNDKEKIKIINTKEILLPGKHNLENVCASVMAAWLVGVSKENIVKVLKCFKGLEHRLELAGTINGVRYYDDSFSTTPETAIAAIEAFKDPEILILGGSSKNSDFTHLGEVISKAENIKAIIGIGKEWRNIKLKIKNEKLKIIESCKDMHEIVIEASKFAEPGDVVLLSPACASFDMFKNYKNRGEQFKQQVLNLKTTSNNSTKIKDQISKIKSD